MSGNDESMLIKSGTLVLSLQTSKRSTAVAVWNNVMSRQLISKNPQCSILGADELS